VRKSLKGFYQRGSHRPDLEKKGGDKGIGKGVWKGRATWRKKGSKEKHEKCGKKFGLGAWEGKRGAKEGGLGGRGGFRWICKIKRSIEKKVLSTKGAMNQGEAHQ